MKAGAFLGKSPCSEPTQERRSVIILIYFHGFPVNPFVLKKMICVGGMIENMISDGGNQ
jgi:hypothetical protein